MKILIADDHEVVRRGLSETLIDEFEDVSESEARNAQEAIDAGRKQAWDIVLLDIKMPGRSGLDRRGGGRMQSPAPAPRRSAVRSD